MGSGRVWPRRPRLGIGRVGGGVLGSKSGVLWQHPSWSGHAHLSPGREGTGREYPGRAPVLEPWPYDRGGETDPGGLRCPCAIAPGGCGRGPPRGTPPERHARSRRGGVGCRLGLPRRTPSHTPLGKSQYTKSVLCTFILYTYIFPQTVSGAVGIAGRRCWSEYVESLI